MAARIFGQRPSELIDPEHNVLNKRIALEFDAFCASLAMQMMSEEKLV